MELGLSLSEVKEISQGEFEYLYLAWKNKVQRQQTIAGHGVAVLINGIGSMMFGDKYKDPISWEDVFPQKKTEVLEEEKVSISAIAAGMFAHFKTEQLKQDQKNLADALERIERFKNG